MAFALLSRAFSSARGSLCVLRYSANYSVEKCFSKHNSSDNRPKKPLGAYFRFYKEKQPIYKQQNPGISVVEITKRIAGMWKELPASDKQSYEAAAKVDLEAYKEQLAKYKAQLSPAQEAVLKEERRRKMEKRKAARKKRQLTMLARPKRSRSAFNIFMSEHYPEAKGASTQTKLKYLFDEWTRLPDAQKQPYVQLAQDDKIRYENEMRSWEDHMIEIGHKELVRRKSPCLPKKERTGKDISEKKATTSKKSLARKATSPEKRRHRVKAKQKEE
uniref:HMG box domain-containing protein n=1 Tax=Salvator merianae TaxID=96440 RepID=A0A8D0C1U4_SALMN